MAHPDGLTAALPDWGSESVLIVASGPSASLACLPRLPCLAVNDSYRLAPWADALYACDGKWWDKEVGAPSFTGLKLTQDEAAANRYGLHRVKLTKGCDRILTEHPGVLGWGGHSGFHALNLAVQWGAKQIILVGYDLLLTDSVHWHGRHPKGMNNPTGELLSKWAAILDAQAPLLEAMGVEVLNASPRSSLKAYRKIDLSEAT